MTEREREGERGTNSTTVHPSPSASTFMHPLECDLLVSFSPASSPLFSLSPLLRCFALVASLSVCFFLSKGSQPATAASTRFFSFFVCFAVHVVCVCVCVFELTTPALLLFPPFLLPLPLCILSIGLIALTFLSSLIFHHTVLRYECTSPFPNQTE